MCVVHGKRRCYIFVPRNIELHVEEHYYSFLTPEAKKKSKNAKKTLVRLNRHFSHCASWHFRIACSRVSTSPRTLAMWVDNLDTFQGCSCSPCFSMTFSFISLDTSFLYAPVESRSHWLSSTIPSRHLDSCLSFPKRSTG